MKRGEKVERLVKDALFKASVKTDETLRARIAATGNQRQPTTSVSERQETRRQKMSARRSWKVAAVVGVVLGAGAISAVGVSIGRYYYYGKNDAGDHVFVSDDREDIVTMGADGVTDVEQARTDLEEIAGLRQQDKRELLGVKETIIGTYRLKTHEYRYHLSDGRTKDMGELADDMPVYDVEQWKGFSPQLEEFRRLQKAGPGDDLGTYEETVKGRVFSFKRERYFLGDGTEVVWSVGEPKAD
ncbi:MAG: hypothetical protein ACYTAS_19640 [Planctomycetota bacterium]|jgi:hypothetical protein